MTRDTKDKKSNVLNIFLTFLKFGCVTFGGGWSIIAQIQKDYVEKRGLITKEQLLDFTSVGRSIPGLMIGNTSVLFGYHLAGVRGALAALFGIIIPPFLIMLGVTFAYTMFKDNIYVARAMMGVRAAVAPIIICAMLKLAKTAMKDKLCWLIAFGAAALCIFTDLSNILVVVLGALAGLLIMEVRTRHGVH